MILHWTERLVIEAHKKRMGLKLNENGIWTEPYPLRFRSEEEAIKFQDGKIGHADLAPPFIEQDGQTVSNPEYEKCPFERGFIMSPYAFKK